MLGQLRGAVPLLGVLPLQGGFDLSFGAPQTQEQQKQPGTTETQGGIEQTQGAAQTPKEQDKPKE